MIPNFGGRVVAHYRIYGTVTGSGLFSLLRLDVLAFTAVLYPLCYPLVYNFIGSRKLFDVDAALMSDRYDLKV